MVHNEFVQLTCVDDNRHSVRIQHRNQLQLVDGLWCGVTSQLQKIAHSLVCFSLTVGLEIHISDHTSSTNVGEGDLVGRKPQNRCQGVDKRG